MKISRVLGVMSAFSIVGSGASASTFYIDEFNITKNGNAWFQDVFEDGSPPPTLVNEITSASRATTTFYETLPGNLPGPETGGKLAIDTANGYSTTSAVTGDPILIQRARLATNTSSAVEFRDNGLKSHHTFSVTGVFDLAFPELQREQYGIRLVDFKSGRDANDNVQLIVNRDLSNNWNLIFREADFENDNFIVAGQFDLSAFATDGFEQIALTLTKAVETSFEITASFELRDLDDETNNQMFSLGGDSNPTIFDGESWTRAEFFAVRPVPVPAALPLFGAALGLLSLVGWQRRQAT